MATPATSNHGWGLAVDVWGANNGRLDWMLQNCDKYGFSWEIQSEPWHIRYVCGDKLPQAVLDYEAKNINL
jgi:LAS superfamily LD-carboxypeptidase LdcB